MGYRTKMMALLVGGLLALGALQEASASAAVNALPELDSGVMSIKWSEFKELLQQLRPAPEVKEKPPFDWAVTRARYEAEAIGGAAVKVDGRLDFVVLKPEGWVAIPILGEAAAPTSVLLDGAEASLVPPDGGWSSLAVEGPGKHTAEISYFVTCSTCDGNVSFALPCPRTPVTQMTLRVPVPEAEIGAPAAAHVAVERGPEWLTAKLAFPSTDLIEVNWTLPAKLLAAEPAEPTEKPQLTCLTSTLASVTEQYVACESRLRYDVLRGALDTFQLRVGDAAGRPVRRVGLGPGRRARDALGEGLVHGEREGSRPPCP